MRRAIRGVGARLLLLPKYSPDLNPIEQALPSSSTGSERRRAETVDTVCSAIGEILDGLTATECNNYFENTGYCST
ncbi:hypothetical protein MesoLj113a_70320 [Mesorhizobium sp. 113-1-2]|nr:hypothetical protein MesoLj113a_70320 [Mesorhizobium sp. 113-1-2]